MVSALISIQRGHPPDDREDSILAAALRVLDERFDGTPVLSDLLEAIESAPERVRMAAFDRGSLPRYQELVEPLQVTLQALLGDGRIGEMFSRQSTVRLDLDRPAAFDVSSIPEDQTELVGAALAACWGVGFGAVNVTHTLAEAGLAPMRHYFIILDELWRALIAGRGMVDRTNSLTRLNRQWGVGVVMCSHTIKDLLSLPDEHERMKALGLIERSGMLICGALPPEEMPRLAQTKDFSVAEQRQLISWQDPPAWSTAAHNDAPPGRGNFMIKIGGRPGIPFRATLTPSELKLNDTSKLWHENSRRGELTPTELASPAARAAVSNPAHRHSTGSSGFSPLLAGTIGIVVVAAAAAEAAVQLGASIDHWRHPPPVDPLALVLELADGKTGWPPAATSLLAIGGGLLLLIAVVVVISLIRGRSRRTHADRAAQVMGRGRDVHPVSRANARATAKRFGVEQEGLPVARAVSSGQPLYATWEDMQCDIWGPRRGKTSARAIPTLLSAPGAAFATSNKPDLHSSTRLLREDLGQVWNFDPERLAGGEPTWWWNPLTYVTSDRRALELTDAFVGAYRDPDARPDPFFDPAGQELVANLLRAAALDRPADHPGTFVEHPPQRRRARPHSRRARARARRRLRA